MILVTYHYHTFDVNSGILGELLEKIDGPEIHVLGLPGAGYSFRLGRSSHTSQKLRNLKKNANAIIDKCEEIGGWEKVDAIIDTHTGTRTNNGGYHPGIMASSSRRTDPQLTDIICKLGKEELVKKCDVPIVIPYINNWAQKYICIEFFMPKLEKTSRWRSKKNEKKRRTAYRRHIGQHKEDREKMLKSFENLRTVLERINTELNNGKTNNRKSSKEKLTKEEPGKGKPISIS